MKITCKNSEAVAKRAFYLAWKASGVFGLGVLQDCGDGLTQEQVLGRESDTKWQTKQNSLYGDYCFGRMMKLSIQWDDTGVTVPDNSPRADYQSWCIKYPSYQSLIEAANLEVNTLTV